MEIDPAVMQRQRELVNRLSLTVDREALAARLRDLRVPMLVMFGDADTLTPPELGSHVLRQRSATARRLSIRDAAHVISSDQPEDYATTVS